MIAFLAEYTPVRIQRLTSRFQKQRDQSLEGKVSFPLSISETLNSPEAEVGAFLAFPALLLRLEKDCSFSFAFPVPSDLSYASFPIPFDVSRIGSLL
jgi:hypothetical protein